jgi:hypothetical protein
MQVGPCIPVGNYWEYRYKRLKLAQLLGQLGVFLTCGRLPPGRRSWCCRLCSLGDRRRAGSGRVSSPPRARSHCCFRNRGTEYVSKSGMNWMSSSTKRQCDRAQSPPRRVSTRTPRRWNPRSERQRNGSSQPCGVLSAEVRIVACSDSSRHA